MAWSAVLEAGVSTIVGLLLVAGGITIELFAVQELLSGAFLPGAWMVALGAIILFAGAHSIDRAKLSDRLFG